MFVPFFHGGAARRQHTSTTKEIQKSKLKEIRKYWNEKKAWRMLRGKAAVHDCWPEVPNHLRRSILSLVWTFSCAQIDLRKAQERELATSLMENRRAVGLLDPMRDKN